MKWAAVAPFELKIGPNESYGRAASVKPPPGAKKAQIRAKIIVRLRVGGMSRRRENTGLEPRVRRHGAQPPKFTAHDYK